MRGCGCGGEGGRGGAAAAAGEVVGKAHRDHRGGYILHEELLQRRARLGRVGEFGQRLLRRHLRRRAGATVIVR